MPYKDFFEPKVCEARFNHSRATMIFTLPSPYQVMVLANRACPRLLSGEGLALNIYLVLKTAIKDDLDVLGRVYVWGAQVCCIQTMWYLRFLAVVLCVVTVQTLLQFCFSLRAGYCSSGDGGVNFKMEPKDQSLLLLPSPSLWGLSILFWTFSIRKQRYRRVCYFCPIGHGLKSLSSSCFTWKPAPSGGWMSLGCFTGVWQPWELSGGRDERGSKHFSNQLTSGVISKVHWNNAVQ